MSSTLAPLMEQELVTVLDLLQVPTSVIRLPETGPERERALEALLVQYTGCPRPDAVLTCSMQLRSLEEALRLRVGGLTPDQERELRTQPTLTQRVVWLRQHTSTPRRPRPREWLYALALAWLAIAWARYRVSGSHSATAVRCRMSRSSGCMWDRRK